MDRTPYNATAVTFGPDGEVVSTHVVAVRDDFIVRSSAFQFVGSEESDRYEVDYFNRLSISSSRESVGFFRGTGLFLALVGRMSEAKSIVKDHDPLAFRMRNLQTGAEVGLINVVIESGKAEVL